VSNLYSQCKLMEKCTPEVYTFKMSSFFNNLRPSITFCSLIVETNQFLHFFHAELCKSKSQSKATPYHWHRILYYPCIPEAINQEQMHFSEATLL
jgi:hypothetical protein